MKLYEWLISCSAITFGSTHDILALEIETDIVELKDFNNITFKLEPYRSWTRFNLNRIHKFSTHIFRKLSVLTNCLKKMLQMSSWFDFYIFISSLKSA